MEIFEHIDGTIASSRFDLCSEIKIKLNEQMKAIYNLHTNKFNQVRGAILENVVHYFGPIAKDFEDVEICIEPVLKDKEDIIDESNVKCDFVS